MKTEVSLEAFIRALRVVRPALRDARDGGAVVHLRVSEERIHLVATGRTMTFCQVVPAVVASVGEIVVPARFLADVCSRGTANSIRLATKSDGDLLVDCGELSATIRQQPGNAPSPITVDGGGRVGHLLGSELGRLSVVASAASKKLERPVLTGVHLGPNIAEATDTYWVARTSLSDWTSDIVIPAVLMQFIAADSADVSATFDGRVIGFETDGSSWTCPVIASAFPGLDRFLAEPATETFICERESLAAAVATASVVHGAPVHLTGEGERLRVWSESTQSGLVQTVLPATARDGHEAAFSSGYLHGALTAATSEEVRLELAASFVQIRCEQFTQLVMKRADGSPSGS